MVDSTKQIFEIARVVDVTDNQGGDMIKARTFNDRTLNNGDIPPAFPLLPKHLYVKPKVGEYVVIMAIDDAHRFFVGPIIPQLNKLEKEDSLYAKSFFEEGIVAPGPNPKQVRGSDGVYPQEDEIAIMGRKNTDIIFKDNEVWLRAGSYIDTPNGKVFSENPTYLMLKNNPDGQYETSEGETITYKTVTTLVADEINLISSSKKAKQLFKVGDPEEMIDTLEMQNILEKAYKLPYGDILADILSDILNFAVTHVHNGNLAPPNLSPETVKLIAEVREKINSKMLSNNIRIN